MPSLLDLGQLLGHAHHIHALLGLLLLLDLEDLSLHVLREFYASVMLVLRKRYESVMQRGSRGG
jgi:hypothetical protein